MSATGDVSLTGEVESWGDFIVNANSFEFDSPNTISAEDIQITTAGQITLRNSITALYNITFETKNGGDVTAEANVQSEFGGDLIVNNKGGIIVFYYV